MAGGNHHSALRSEVLETVNAGHAEIALAKLQSSKIDISYALHVNPTTFISSGFRTTDWLQLLGFQENSGCQFLNGRCCYCLEVAEGYDVRQFAQSFNEGLGHLRNAVDGISECGFWPPGGREMSARARAYHQELGGDGHTAMNQKVLATSEDATFRFSFTFIETGRDRGFVTHYVPQHPPLSTEVRSAFKYLGLKEFKSCPEFDFDPCFYRTLQLFGSDNPFDGNVDFAHKSFQAHATRFSPAIEALLAAQSAVERVGLSFLPIAKPTERLKLEIAQQIRPASAKPAPTMAFDEALPSNFDVAMSFAGADRQLAEKLSELVQAAGFTVFYDNFYPEQLWGKNLTAFLDDIYRKRARYCVVFVSKDYKERQWTNHELRSAQAKALELKGHEYILPVRVDDTELDGLPPNVGYVSAAVGVEQIADLLIKKLRG